HAARHGDAALAAEEPLLGDPEELAAPIALARIVRFVAADHRWAEAGRRLARYGGDDLERNRAAPEGAAHGSARFRRSSSERAKRTPSCRGSTCTRPGG